MVIDPLEPVLQYVQTEHDNPVAPTGGSLSPSLSTPLALFVLEGGPTPQ